MVEARHKGDGPRINDYSSRHIADRRCDTSTTTANRYWVYARAWLHEIRLRSEAVSEDEVVTAPGDFDPMWEALSPREQARVLQLLIERVEYNGDAGTVSVTFRPSGIKALAEENAA